MRTLPDTIDLIKYKMIRGLDSYYAVCEKYGGKIGWWEWNKRRCNREKGTGYKK